MNTNSAAEFGNKVQSCGTEYYYYYYYYFMSRISYSLFSVLFRYYSSSAFSTFWIRLFGFRFLRRFFLNEFYEHKVTCTSTVKKVKVAHTRLASVGSRSWSWFFAVSLQVTAVGCHYFPPGLQLPPQPLRGLNTKNDFCFWTVIVRHIIFYRTTLC